jgi:phosphoribosyl 1,2-cyclic phosphodiesterase
MRFASLGSGSRGNALVVEAGTSRLLLDCGFGLRETVTRLARLGLSPDDLAGVLVSHEHGDHSGGVFRLAQRHRLKIWLTRGTLSAVQHLVGPAVDIELIVGDTPFAVDGIEVLPYPVPHDAREPVQFVFSDGHSRLGVLTDAGCVTRHIEQCLNGCNALVLECNHDAEMLAAGAYPASLKARIAGRFGHLDNASAAALLAALDLRPLKHVVAAHLSEQNNRPELARHALAGALDCTPEWIGIAHQEEGLSWRELR